MDKYLIVTGANGYLGKYICIYALKNDYKVIAFKYSHWASTLINHKNINYIEVDITQDLTQNKTIEQSVKGKNIVAIINAAALLGSADIDKNRAVNATGVANMIALSKLLGVKKFVQVSSVVIMKEIKGPYGITKLEGQEILTKTNLDWTVFIPAMILGPESLGVNRVLKNVFRIPGIVPLIGSGKETQHPIFVKDFAEYLVKAAINPKSNQKIYQIASETVIPFKSLIKLMLNISNKNKMFISVPVWVAKALGNFFQATQKIPVFTAEHVKGLLQDSNLDISELKKDLDFKPTPLEEALSYTLKEINGNWDFYLAPREEQIIEIE